MCQDTCVCFPWCLKHLVDIWTLTNNYSLNDQTVSKHKTLEQLNVTLTLNVWHSSCLPHRDTHSFLPLVWFLCQRQVCSFQSETHSERYQHGSNRATVVCGTYIKLYWQTEQFYLLKFTSENSVNKNDKKIKYKTFHCVLHRTLILL